MKKIIAAAVAAAVIAPMSVIAAGPTLYGKIHMSTNWLDNGGTNHPKTNLGVEEKYSEWSLNSNASRIGVKGSEDLGNGMKVGYLIEWQVGMDGSENTAAAGNAKDMGLRNRAVTLSGGWGTLLAGKWDTPMKVLGRKVDLFGERIGDLRNMNKGAVLLDQRTSNTVAYVTPNMGGFSVTGAYVFDVTSNGSDRVNGNTADDTDFQAYSINAIYNNGPFMLGAAYEGIRDKAFETVAASQLFNTKNQNTWRVAGSWQIASFKLLGSYTGVSSGNGIKNNDPNIWHIGGTWQFGNNTLKGQYAARSDESFRIDTRDDLKLKSKASEWVIGLDHALSKRTTLYTEYGMLYNDNASHAAVWGTTGNSASGAIDQTSKGFGLGIIHNF